MLMFYVNGHLIDIDEVTTVSLSYELTNKEDPSSFTTVYSSTVDFPMTGRNRKVFGFPDIVMSVSDSYMYSVYRNGVLLDTGSLAVYEVTDSKISCNLYSSAVTMSALLNGEDENGDKFTLKSFTSNTAYDKNGVRKSIVGKSPVQADNFTADVPQQGEEDLNLVRLQGHEDGFLYWYASNIGRPKDFDTRDEFDGTTYTDMGRGEVSILKAPKEDVGGSWYYQYRTYQLNPVVPMMTIFRNVLGEQVLGQKGFSVSISDKVAEHLSKIGYVGPKISDIDEFKFGDYKTNWEYSSSKSITGSVSRNTIAIKDMLTPTTGYVGPVVVDSEYSITTCFYIVNYSDSDGNVSNTLVYPSDKYNYEYFNREFSSNFTSANSFPYNQGLILKYSSIAGSGTYTISVDTVVNRAYKSGTTGQYRHVYDKLMFADSLDNEYDYGVSFLIDGAVYAGNPSISIQDYYKYISNPWDIVKNVCKKYNIRFKQTGIKTFELVFTEDYYNSPKDITRYVDVKDKKIANHYFDSKYLLFRDVPIESAWIKNYKDIYDDDYGRGKIGTDYPVDSSEEWFSDGVNYMCTPRKYVFRYPDEAEVTTIDMIGEAYDEDGNEIDITGCLCDMTPSAYDIERDSMAVALCDNIPNYTKEQCYYADGYLAGVCTNITVPKLRTCDVNGRELLMYGNARAMPEGSSIKNNIDEYFKDVLDSVKGKTMTVRVDIHKLKMSVYDFVTTVFWFENTYWVVADMKNYNLGVDSPTEVTFLKINQLSNYYKPENITVDANISNGSVVAMVDGVEVALPYTAPKGTRLTFTVTPNEGYRWRTWDDGISANPRTIIMNSSKVYNGICESAAEYVTLTMVGVHCGTSPTIGTHQYPVGTVVNVDCTPDSGYTFGSWSDGGSKSHSVTLYDDMTLTATCVEAYVTLTMVGVHCGTTPTIGTHQYLYGTTITVDCDPDEGYQFNHWSDGGTKQHQITLTYDMTLTATCVQEYVLLTMNGVNCTTSPAIGQHSYAYGTTITVDCTPYGGYEFGSWSDGGTQSHSITLYEDTILTATCVSLYVTLDISGVNCTTSPSAGTYQYLRGSVVTVNCTPAEGYRFSSWNDGGAKEHTVTLNADLTLIATCTQISTWTGLKFTSTGRSTIIWHSGWTGSACSYYNVTYSLDEGETWVPYSITTRSSSLAIELLDTQTVCWRASYSPISTFASRFLIEGSVSASGDITSIINQVGGVTDLTGYRTGDVGVFQQLFQECTALTSVPVLPSTILEQRCYFWMFAGCTSIVNPPELPATTLADECYSYMFYGCTSLVTAPKLLTLNLSEYTYTYTYMFSGCTSLTGPIEIRAVMPWGRNGSNACTGMFADAGTNSGTGGTIYVGGYVDEWIPAASITTPHTDKNWDVRLFPQKYAVNFSCEHGTVLATVDGSAITSGTLVLEGKSVVFTIAPDEGYEYEGTNPETVVVDGTITKDYVCTQPVQYVTLVIDGIHCNTLPSAGSHQYVLGEEVIVDCLPGAGYKFDHWSDGGAKHHSIVMDGNKSLTATCVVDYVTLTISGSNCTTSPAAGTHQYMRGLSVTVDCTPDSGYVFSNWSDGGAQSHNVLMNDDVTLTATCVVGVKLNMYGVSCITTPSIGEHTYPIGSVVTVNCIPDLGYKYDHWSDGGAQSHEVTLNADMSLTATCVEDYVTLNISGVNCTTQPPTGSYQYLRGQSVTVDCTPGLGYEFGSWSDGGEQQHVVTMTDDLTLIATCNLATYTVIIRGDNCVTTPVQGTYYHHYGDIIELDCTPNEGYHFVQWSDSPQKHHNFIVYANVILTAYCEQDEVDDQSE